MYANVGLQKNILTGTIYGIAVTRTILAGRVRKRRGKTKKRLRGFGTVFAAVIAGRPKKSVCVGGRARALNGTGQMEITAVLGPSKC